MALEIIHPRWGEHRPIRGVLFDMDGILLDSETLYSRFWREACGVYGFSMSYEQSLAMRSLGRQLGARILREFFGPEADYTAIRNKRIELMDAHVAGHGIALKPGTRELLVFLKEAGIPAAITSSSPIEKIREYMAFHGLQDCFAALCSGRDTPRGKPEPDIYLHGAAMLGLPPESCLALEDSPAGIRSAHRAGCLTVMVPDQDPPGEAVTPLLYAVAESLHDIIPLIQTQNGHP